MKIPRIPTPDGISGKAWESSSNGKGSGARSNGSDQFRDNYDEIFKERTNRPGHTRIVYGPSGKTEIIN